MDISALIQVSDANRIDTIQVRAGYDVACAGAATSATPTVAATA